MHEDFMETVSSWLGQRSSGQASGDVIDKLAPETGKCAFFLDMRSGGKINRSLSAICYESKHVCADSSCKRTEPANPACP